MGASVYIIGRNLDNLKKTYLDLEGMDNVFIQADLTNTEELYKISSKLPILDGVVHSAGVSNPIPFSFLNEEKINQTFSINFNAPVLLNLSLLKEKKINKKAKERQTKIHKI